MGDCPLMSTNPSKGHWKAAQGDGEDEHWLWMNRIWRGKAEEHWKFGSFTSIKCSWASRKSQIPAWNSICFSNPPPGEASSVSFLPFSGVNIYLSLVTPSDLTHSMILFPMERWALNTEYFMPVVKTLKLNKINTSWGCYHFLLQRMCFKKIKDNQKRGKIQYLH